MDIGILGAATVGQARARHLADTGHDETVANSRGPESLREVSRNWKAGLPPVTSGMR
ncbi:putative dinucleotide-binding enzyme [Rhodobium orientis]|uniref:NAD(P)-binding domain-containing protein n=1 Tax=Rhodobium orientis TaxID=34017 RepID=UPI0014749785|nr:NAD(P)-binding domain-containing protein [Rhodobium orientis]MBB4302815.1 putative dinucleotide-binding enzyme [Rhodobium orientis]